MTGFDWPLLMQAGIKGLGLEPQVFWSLTPAELAWLMGQTDGQMPMDRAGLEALAEKFPDKRRTDE